MKKSITTILILGIFLLSSPQQVSASSNREVLLAQINQLLQEIQRLQALLEEQKSESSITSDFLSSSALVRYRYRVYDPNTFSWVENQVQRELMARFVALLPDEFDNRFKEFIFYEDSRSDIDAFVETMKGVDDWRVGFGEVLLDQPVYSNETTELLIHEIGHVVAYKEYKSVPYLELFRESFWETSAGGREFVSSYAMQSVEEDFSESFLQFILQSGYSGPGSEKVQFFNQYPELMQYRAEIVKNL